MPLEPYPLDFDALEKGSEISVDRLELIVGVSRENLDYQIRILRLKEKVEKELQSRGKILTIAIVAGSIRILRDVEASEYNARQSKLALRQLQRSQKRNLHVDTSSMTPDQRAEHDRQLLVNGAILSASRSIRRRSLTVMASESRPVFQPLLEEKRSE